LTGQKNLLPEPPGHQLLAEAAVWLNPAYCCKLSELQIMYKRRFVVVVVVVSGQAA
jgi:hypothetical protein